MTFLFINKIYLLLAVIVVVVVRLVSKPRRTPLPPGPKGLPIVGNIKDLPPHGQPEWLHWLKLKEKYGPISSVTVTGQTIVLIHDITVALGLMEKRSAEYSSRPRMVFGGEMCGWKDAVAVMPYGDRLRTARKNAYSILGTKVAVSQFQPLQEREARRTLFRILNDPSNVVQHLKTQMSATILKATYDYTIEPHQGDPLVDLADTAIAQFSIATQPGLWMVDVMPFLKYLPDWLPGTGFKRTARLWRQTVIDVVNIPYSYTKRRTAYGDSRSSFVSKLLVQNENIGTEDENTLKWTAMSLYVAGGDTSVAALSCFFLAMTLFPEVQRKAHEEIERVVGNNRLPVFGDDLPYIEAIATEALRWHPAVPLAFPHISENSDMYNGYLIPKGALIITNSWWLLHDPEIYEEPMAFRPERFLPTNPEREPDPRNCCFGYGRRICPGRLLADNSIFLTIAQCLAAFNISKAIDEAGKEIEPTVEFTPGIVSHPVPFKCTITPRSQKYEKLIKNVEMEFPWEESNAQDLGIALSESTKR